MLRRVLLVTAALFLSASAPCAAEVQTTLAGRIIRVSDGDTVTLLTADKKSIRIRLAGIDAPESKQAWGTRARQAMMSCAYGKTAVVLSHKTDRYGRRVGLLTVNGVDCGLQLLHSGLAWFYVAYERELPYKVRNVYRNAESEARKLKRGLWADKTPTAPWDWRKARRRSDK